MTLEELLIRKQKVLAAIEAIESGAQRVRLGDVEVSKADIRRLYEELRELEKQIAAASGSYNTRVFVRFV